MMVRASTLAFAAPSTNCACFNNSKNQCTKIDHEQKQNIQVDSFSHTLKCLNKNVLQFMYYFPLPYIDY